MAKFMKTDYCSFFATDSGQRVLADMLLEGGFFKINKTPEEQAVENFLKTVLAKTGKFPIEGVSDASRIVSYVSHIGRINKRIKIKQFLRELFKMRTEY